MEKQVNNKKIAKNTLLLYFRTIIVVVVSLYTSRLILAALGVNDFGIYNVVGGIVTILSFLNTSMAGATQRFLNVELGKGNQDRVNTVFSTAQRIHLMIATAIFVLAETIGLWFLNGYMNIDGDRLNAANWVFQCSIISFILTVISVPYNAAIISHEKMGVFAYISIVEVGFKLLIAYLLIISTFDRLILYAILMAIVAATIRLIYGIYCSRNFEECRHFSIKYDHDTIKQMLSFSGWTIFGALGSISHTQGIAILINMVFGVAVNSAQGIANQVTNVVTQFVNNFMTALNPQIVKSYAAKETEQLCTLVKRGSRMGICLVTFFVIPIVLKTPLILHLWLKEVPDYTATFIRIILITSLCSSFAYPLATARAATGKIRTYQIVLTTMAWLHLPFAWLFFKLGFAPQSAMYVYLVIVIAEQMYRIWNVCPAIGLSILDYIKDVIIRCGVMILLAFVPSFGLTLLLPDTLYNSILLLFTSFAFTLGSILFIGITANERKAIAKMIKTKLSQID